MPSFDAVMDLPDGRKVISSSPEDLQSAFHIYTLDQFNRALGGKWFKFVGQIDDSFGSGRISLKQQHSPVITLTFEQGWEDQLSKLPRGSIVTVRCKMTDAYSISINLSECEML
jgi:hypothetical protein